MTMRERIMLRPIFAALLLMISIALPTIIEAQQAALGDSWRPVSSLQPSETLKVKLKSGSTVKGTLKSASADSLVLEQKTKEI
jgi:hypothetical protein